MHCCCALAWSRLSVQRASASGVPRVRHAVLLLLVPSFGLCGGRSAWSHPSTQHASASGAGGGGGDGLHHALLLFAR
jgi:hypothetical protein